MSRSSNISQRQRTQNDPLILGTFSETSLRYLTGKLGPENRVGLNGYGGGTMNHWFQINIASPAWIITRKGGPRPNYIEVSAYDLNKTPIEGRMIFQADSVSTIKQNGEKFYPYLGHVMGAGSDLANTFNSYTLNRADDLYFILETGSYLICVSSTRNEPLDYTLGLVVEFPAPVSFILLEDLDCSFLIQETLTEDFNFELEPSDSYTMDVEHDHSLAEWTKAWQRERDPDAHLPELFVPLTDRP